MSNKLGTKHSWVKGIQCYSNEVPSPFPREDNYELAKIHWLNLKNHWANFNQTWLKASLGEGDSSVFKWRDMPFFQGEIIMKYKNTLTKSKILLLQNHWVNFIQTWHKASLGKEKEDKDFTDKDHFIIKKRRWLVFSSPNQWYDIIIALNKCVYWFELVSHVSNVANGPLV